MRQLFIASLAAVAFTFNWAWSETIYNGSSTNIGNVDNGIATSTRPALTGVGAPSPSLCNTARSITTATPATPPVVTASTAHGFSSGDVVGVYGTVVGGMTGLTGVFMVQNLSNTTLSLCGYWDGSICQNPPTTSGTYTSGAFISKQVGREYFRLDAAAGQNEYYCTDSTGSPAWTQQGPTTNQNIREINALFSGGGSPLTGTPSVCRNVAFAGTIQQLTLESDLAGASSSSNQVDLKTVAFASYTGPASATTITGTGTIPKLGTGVRFQDSTFANWASVSLGANTAVCVALSNPSNATWISVNIKLGAN
jgi:hypothetical protein